ncbi:MAG: glycosyltransferase family 2 protein [Polyangiaceae bacterium]
MHKTVVICTRNRAAELEAALVGALDETRCADDARVLVVDNGSTDATRAVVLGYPDVRLLSEPRVGLSHARNLALREAPPGILVYLDDDAVPRKGWLEAICAPFAADPKVAAVGGRVLPSWRVDPPAWTNSDLIRSVFSLLEHEDSFALNARTDAWLVGANFAVRTDALAAVGGFATRLGRRDSGLLSGEEELVVRRLKRRGRRRPLPCGRRRDPSHSGAAHPSAAGPPSLLRPGDLEPHPRGDGGRRHGYRLLAAPFPAVAETADHVDDLPFEIACLCAEMAGYMSRVWKVTGTAAGKDDPSSRE